MNGGPIIYLSLSDFREELSLLQWNLLPSSFVFFFFLFFFPFDFFAIFSFLSILLLLCCERLTEMEVIVLKFLDLG